MAFAGAFAREVAEFDPRTSSSVDAALTAALVEALETWRSFAPRDNAGSARRSLNEARDSTAPVNGDIDTPHHGSSAIDWAAIQTELQSAGLLVARRGEHEGSRILAACDDLVVIEVMDADGGIVAEGKGLESRLALVSALGEAAERAVAADAQFRLDRVATTSELVSLDYHVPALHATPADLYSADLPMAWTEARAFDGARGAIPAELAGFPFRARTGVRAFAVQHTAGLAAGATADAAAIAGLRECVETDAYWLSMRAMHVHGVFDLAAAKDARLRKLMEELHAVGIRVWAGSIAFDWPFPIAHVVLETEVESLPALSHGLGSGATWSTAVSRALHEAIQVYSGLERVSLRYWEDVSVRPERSANAAIIWASKAFAPRAIAPFREAPDLNIDAPFEGLITDVPELTAWMAERGMRAWSADLGTMGGLRVARTFIDGAVSPFSERGAPSERVMATIGRLGLRRPYLDPILT